MAEMLVLTAVLTPDPDGGYVAQIAELPGAISQGDTMEDALANVREAAEVYLADATPEEVAALDSPPGDGPCSGERRVSRLPALSGAK